MEPGKNFVCPSRRLPTINKGLLKFVVTEIQLNIILFNARSISNGLSIRWAGEVLFVKPISTIQLNPRLKGSTFLMTYQVQ